MTPLARIQEQLLICGADAVLIRSAPNRQFATGFSSSEGLVIITRSRAYFIVDFRYIEAARSAVSNFEIVLLDRGIYQMAGDILKENDAKNIVFEGNFVTYAAYLSMKKILKNFTLNPDDAFLSKLREVKSPQEIKWISQAQRIGEDTFRHICPLIKAGISEMDIAIEIDYHMRKLGGQMPAFDTIVVSGQNSSKPHGVPTSKKIENGDFVTMDFGTKIHGYCGDMTRTVAVGFATEEMKRVYEVVCRAQDTALAGIRALQTGKEADALARDVIGAAGFGPCFGHSLGHGVGLDIHEEPRFSHLSETIIEENTVVSVEPGIYLPGKFGVRIEDLVVVEKNGVRNLNTLGNEMIIL
jgi:Xaa-Pro aminopeptidase